MISGEPAVTLVVSNTLQSSTANTATYAILISGPLLCVVGFKVTIYSFNGASPLMEINSTPYVLNDTFNITLDATGKATLTQLLSIANSPGNNLQAQITIETVSVGNISSISFFWSNVLHV